MQVHFDEEEEAAGASATEKTGSTPNFQVTWGGPLNGKIPIENSRALAGSVHVVHHTWVSFWEQVEHHQHPKHHLSEEGRDRPNLAWTT